MSSEEGQKQSLRVNGQHGGNLWMMVSPTVEEKGSVFQVALPYSDPTHISPHPPPLSSACNTANA